MKTYTKNDTYNLMHTDRYVKTYTSIYSNTYIKTHTLGKIQRMGTFSENLRKVRKESGLSQEALADKLGILRTNYIPIEKGKNPPSDNLLERLSQIEELNVDFKTLRTWKMMDVFPELFTSVKTGDIPEILKFIIETQSPEQIKALIRELKGKA